MLRNLATKLLLLMLIVLFSVNSIISSVYANAEKKEVPKDYKFTFLKQKGGKNHYYLDKEGKNDWISATEYNKKYKKIYTEAAKLTEPITPEEPEEAKSVLKKSLIKKLNKMAEDTEYINDYIQYEKEAKERQESPSHIRDFYYSGFVDLTNYKSVKKTNQRTIDFIEEKTGIKTNEKYFEELTSNTLKYLDNKMLAQMHNKNNPYRSMIEDLRSSYSYYTLYGKEGDKYRSLALWLMHGGKYRPDLYNQDNHEMTPYYNLLSMKTTFRKNRKVEVIAITTHSTSSVISYVHNKYTDTEYYTELNLNILEEELKDREINSDKKARFIYMECEPYGSYKESDFDPDLLYGEDEITVIMLLGGDLYTARFIYRDEKIRLLDMKFEGELLLFF